MEVYFCMCILHLVVLSTTPGAESKFLHELRHNRAANPSEDMASLEMTQQQQAQQLEALEAKMAAMQEQLDSMTSPLLFTGTTGPARHSYSHGQVVKFPSVLENVGAMYDADTGIVTIPRSGTYLVYVRPDDADDLNDNLFLTVVVNNAPKITAYAFHGVPSSGAGALTLQKGDRVWVQTANGDRMVEAGTLFSIVRISG